MPTLHRLHVPDDLREAASINLSQEAGHYLLRVLRMETGQAVLVFNGRDGEWMARIGPAERRGATLRLEERTRVQTPAGRLTLMFAPLKKARTDFVVEKATELGVARILPVITQRTQAESVRADRLRLIAVEAAEQTGRLDVPVVEEAMRLDRVLADWPGETALLFCDEAGDAPLLNAWLALRAAVSARGQAGGILIGPEGGFTPAEREILRSRECVVPVSLGPRVLRAETAALAALTLWQAHLGDWD